MSSTSETPHESKQNEAPEASSAPSAPPPSAAAIDAAAHNLTEADLTGAPTADQATHALVKPKQWKGNISDKWDDHIDESMRATRLSAARAHPGAMNVGLDYELAAPLAPINGWYDARYVCATRRGDALDDEEDFEELFHPAEGLAEPPVRVALACKGLTDLHCEWIARQLDEKPPETGGKAWWLEAQAEAAADGGAIPAAEARKGVEVLFLNDNPISSEGIRFIADALARNTTLRELYLHYTDLRDEGLQELLGMLSRNSSLEKLELGCCGIGHTGAIALKQALKAGKVSKKLRHLGLFSNDDAVDADMEEINALLPGATGR